MMGTERQLLDSFIYKDKDVACGIIMVRDISMLKKMSNEESLLFISKQWKESTVNFKNGISLFLDGKKVDDYTYVKEQNNSLFYISNKKSWAALNGDSILITSSPYLSGDAQILVGENYKKTREIVKKVREDPEIDLDTYDFGEAEVDFVIDRDDDVLPRSSENSEEQEHNIKEDDNSSEEAVTTAMIDDIIYVLTSKEKNCVVGDFSSDLTILNIPESVTYFGVNYFNRYLFVGNSKVLKKPSLLKIVIPATMIYINMDFFNGFENLQSIEVDPNNANYHSIKGCLYDNTGILLFVPMGQSGSIYIPDGTKVISSYAFFLCKKLNEIYIPDTVSEIYSAFISTKCKIIVSPHNDKFISINDTLYDKGQTELIHLASINAATTFKVPQSVKIIREYACFHNLELEFVSIYNGIISNNAFRICHNLSTLVIGENVTEIADEAFYNCPNLKSIYIRNIDPSQIKYGVNVFWGLARSLCILHVPKGCFIKYSTNGFWGSFTHIKEDIDMNDSWNSIIARSEEEHRRQIIARDNCRKKKSKQTVKSPDGCMVVFSTLICIALLLLWIVF
jgi:hypothetical protein